MKAKLWLFFAALLFSLSFASLVSAQTGQVYFNEDFNYASLDQMQAAGWTFTRPVGISVAASAVTLDGTKGDCAMHRATSFSNNVYDWKAEVKSMWLGEGHSVLSVFVATERHVYGWAADGYYKEYSLYRDSQKILHFGNYAEKANQYIVLTMVRQANTFSFYFNGNLINTYTEEDTVPSKVTSLEMVSPWRGDAKYDYYQLGEPTAVFTSSNPTGSTDSFPMIPVLVGGGIAAAVVGGIVVYYFVIAGGSAGASAGPVAGVGGSGGGTGQGGHGSSGSSSHPEQPYSDDSPYGSGQTDPQSQQSSNYDPQQTDDSPYGSGQTDPQSQQSSNYDPQQTDDSPYGSGQTDPQSQQSSNYDPQQTDDSPYGSGQTDPQSQQSSNYESSRGTNENTKSNKKNSTKTE